MLRYYVTCDVTMTATSAFGELVKHYRVLRGLSLRQVEEQLGMSATNISRIERGLVGAPPKELIERIANVLDAPADQLARAAGIMLENHSDDIDLEEAILSDSSLDGEEREFLLQALRLVRKRPTKRK
jgi:transcriptional regulator with XRE-family HTH domain